jgi:hypothetical protein
LAQTETFRIREAFGVSHPRQIIDFDLHSKIDAAKSYMIGPDGTEVPFQLLRDQKIAVETDLPAGSEKTWRLYEGRATTASAAGVEVKTTDAWYELTNGLTGVRIPRGNGATDLAPVQGIRYRDGVWTGTGPGSMPNYLLDTAERHMAARTLAVRFLERGPLKTVAQLNYTYTRPDLMGGNKVLIPGGAGYYRCTIGIEAGQPSILIEEDTDMDLRYQFLISPGLDPDQARYRGHHSTKLVNGRKADGTIYNMSHERPEQDAIRDLRFDPPAPSSYSYTDPYIRRMAVWDPWVFDSGWYWQLYNASAGAGANLFGIFAGSAAVALGAVHNGAGVFTTHDAAGKRATGIRLELNRRSPDARIFPKIRLIWGIFVGIKGQDLKDPREIQGIGRQMNLHGGINLNKVHRYPVDAELRAAAKPLYMSAGVVEKLAAKVRRDTAYYQHLSGAEATARPLLDFWREGTAKRREEVVKGIGTIAHDLLDALVNGNGIYDFNYHYWMGGLQMSRQAVWINAVLSSPEASAEDKHVASAAAVLFAEVLWDNDFVPLFWENGLNLGTANMAVQQRGYRDLYALLLADQPWMRGRVEGVVKSAIDDLHESVNEAGAHMGSTHYLEASMGPLLSTLQQIQTAGVGDPFKSEPRLSGFAEFLMNLLTPPEQRFGGTRKLVSIGDAAAESSELFGQLATGFSGVDPNLSARLMWAWTKNGAMHSGFHGTTILKINEALPMKDPVLGDATFPGWYSVLRNGWGTRDETAVWFVNGDFYRDHAHEDNGNVAIYALGAPLSVDWGSMYDPPSPGAMMHNAPVPEGKLKTSWDGEAPSEWIGARWEGAEQEAFESFAHSSYARARFRQPDGAVWRRSVYSIHPDASLPVVVIRDQFEGAGAQAAKILSFNVMATGPVETPAGRVAPPSSAQALGEGLSRFGFAGVPQAGRVATDADIYVSGAGQALIGHWVHHFAPTWEQGEFQQANKRPFEEGQHILRLRGTAGFLLVLLPHRHNETRTERVTESGSSVTVKTDDETLTFDADGWSFAGPQGSGGASFGAGSASAGDLGVSGGPAEVFYADGQTTVTIHGPAGQRTVRWQGGVRTFDYPGGKPMTVVLKAAA